jgi:hypothetical protein
VNPPEPEPPVAIGAFIAGIVVGLPVGSIAILLILATVFAILGGATYQEFPFIFNYVVGLGALIGAIFAVVRMRLNFWLGLWIGAAAGSLGATALCNLIVGAPGPLH